MGIDVQVERETGEVIAAVYDVENTLSSAVLNGRFTDLGGCLKYLDPYGDAIFNQLQLPVVLEEIRDTCHATEDQPLRERLLEIETLIRDAHGQTHTYVRFVGD